MRIVAAVLIWVVFVGGVWLYMHSRPTAPPPVQRAAATAAGGRFTLEITTTCRLAPDAFAVRLATTDRPAALAITRQGQPILRRTEDVARGTMLLDVTGKVVAGDNELYVEAYPAAEALDLATPVTPSLPIGPDAFDAAAGAEHALRLRVLRNGQPVAEHTFWTGPVRKVGGTFAFYVAPAVAGDDHDH